MIPSKVPCCTECGAFVPVGTCPICEGESVLVERQYDGGYTNEAELIDLLRRLPKKAMVEILVSISKRLWFDSPDEVNDYVNRVREWDSAADFMEAVSAKLDDYGITPYQHDPDQEPKPSENHTGSGE